MDETARALDRGGDEGPAGEDPGRALLTRTIQEAGPALARALVEEVFQGVLGRSPGPQGAEAYPRRLREGMALRELAAELIARPDFPGAKTAPPPPPEYFDGERYLRDNPDLAAAGLDPLEHYLRHGRNEGRAAFDRKGACYEGPGRSSSYFDGDRYLRDHPDIAEAGLDPLEHYLRHGLAEGRAAYGEDGRVLAPPSFPPPPAPMVVHSTTPPDLLQLAQDLLTTRLIAEGADIQLPPGDHPPASGMERSLRSMLLTLGMLLDQSPGPCSESRRGEPFSQ